MNVTRVALVAVMGPTASGKSALGVVLAERLGGEVVVCDSTQVYRGFDLGTAKVRAEERRGIPHHLLDLVDAHEVFTAGDYRRRALETLADLRRRGKLPVFTVGTGLYFRGLVEGLADAPARSESLRARLRGRALQRGPAHLHRILGRLDPEAAARIAPGDLPKVIRAIEVSVLGGRPISAVHRAGRARLEGYHVIPVGLNPPRAALYDRIHARVQEMLEAGWLEEVRRGMDAGIAATAKPFQFIGYGELREHLEGRRALAEAVAAIQQATRRYAKRQLTWFRREAGVKWFAGFGGDPQVIADILAYVTLQLGAGELARARPD